MPQVADDLRTLYASLRPAVPCSSAERRRGLVDLARGESYAGETVKRRDAAAARVITGRVLMTQGGMHSGQWLHQDRQS